MTTPPRSRTELRQERYSYARQLGFSAKEARQMRDWSAERINQRITTEQRQLSRISRARRTEEQQRRLEQIRRARRQEQTDPARQPTQIQTRQQRLNQFREWSRTRRFPENVRQYVANVNLESGRDPNDSYGFRVFYWRYVFDMPEVQAIRRVETRDT